MEDSILSPTVSQKLYSRQGILIGTVMGGPLITGYLLTRNYKALSLQQKQFRTWLICIIAFAATTFLAFNLTQIPSVLFLFPNAAFGYYATQNLQGEIIQSHIAGGGPLHSNWRCAVIAVLFTLIVIAMALLCFFLADVYAGRF